MGKINKLNVFTGFIICFIILNAFSIFFQNGHCSNLSEEIIWVDDDFPYPKQSTGSLTKPYKYISSAINAASNGDTIIVLSGVYSEDLFINKSINIISENVNNTIINSSSKNKNMIDIVSNSVTIEGFTIYSGTTASFRRTIIYISESADDVLITDNKLDNISNIIGINIEGANRVVIRNNTINNSKGIQIINSNDNYIYNNSFKNCSNCAAIRIYSSKSNIIKNNIIRNSLQGIFLKEVDDSKLFYNDLFKNELYGIAIKSGENNNISENKINNSNIGMKINSPKNNIISNNFTNNSVGISIDSSNCIIRNNVVINSSNYGIYASMTSSDNRIYDNTINSTSFYYLGVDEGENLWDNEKIGNYWSDYYGPDNNVDGIGEIVYTKGGVYDRYPKGIFNKLPQIMNNSPANLENGTDIRPTLSVKVIDPEGQRMNVFFYYLKNETSFFIDVVNNVKSNTTASIPFYSTVEGKNTVYSYEGHGYDYICLWYVIVEDTYSSNKSSEWIFTTKQVPIDNEKPNVDTGGPYEGVIGESISFDGSGCMDIDGDVEFYRWSFGDGISQSQTISPKHVYKNPGVYTVTLIIIDDGGRTNIATTTATISAFSKSNNPPFADIGGPYFKNDVGEIVFDGSYSYDNEGEITNYTWDFGDGNIGYGSLITHNYSKNGNYSVILIVTDENGNIDMISTTVFVGSSASINNSIQFDTIYLILIAIVITICICGILFWRRHIQ